MTPWEKIDLPQKTKDALARFAEPSRKKNLKAEDWQRFYRFIRYCHGRRVELSPHRVKGLLMLAGFPPFQAEELAYVYEHGRDLLKTKFPKDPD